MIGGVIGAYKPDLEGAGLQKDAFALHEAALSEMTSKNCTLQVHKSCTLKGIMCERCSLQCEGI